MTYRCKVHGEITEEHTITVTIEPYCGHYCQKCFAHWINQNITRAEPLPDKCCGK